MSDTFRIGLSPGLAPKDGWLAFPSYNLDALSADPRFDLSYIEVKEPLTAADLQGFDAIILLGERMAATSFPEDGRLALICRMGVGYDTVDVPACSENNVALTITPESARRPMAQATMTLMLALAGNLFVKDRMTRQGPQGWDQRVHHHGLGLHDRTLGLIGVGNIGREVVKLAKPYDMRIIGHDPAYDNETAADVGFELVSTEAVFKEADFVSIHCFLSEATHHLVNAERLAMMQPGAYLINTARGPIVDQAALTAALQNNAIAGAGLDVLDPEPSAVDDPLNALDNVILTPHAMGWTDHMFAAMAAGNMQAIRAVAGGEIPNHCVNTDVFERTVFNNKLDFYLKANS
jgi:phosphoglycerate dehydrogenase-like enzyme